MIAQLFKENLSLVISAISLLIASLSFFLSYKNWKMAKAKFGEEKRNLFLNFSRGIESLKSIYLIFHSLQIKNLKTITIENLKADKLVLERILKALESSENHLIYSNITQLAYFNLLREIPIVIAEINHTKKLEFIELNSLSTKIGFLYYNAYLMQPTVYPKKYNLPNFSKEKDFVTYFNDLVYNKQID